MCTCLYTLNIVGRESAAISPFAMFVIQAKLEIEVRAHLHAKLLVVTEAKKLGARYVVIDR